MHNAKWHDPWGANKAELRWQFSHHLERSSDRTSVHWEVIYNLRITVLNGASCVESLALQLLA